MTDRRPLSVSEIARIDQLAAKLDDLVGMTRKHLPDCDAPDTRLCCGAAVADALIAAGPRCITLLAMALVRLARDAPPARLLDV